MGAGGELARGFLFLTGASYRMIVEKSDGRFFASWLCMTCTELAGTTVRGSSIEEALSRAIVRLHDHHAHFHCCDPHFHGNLL
jgi:hypothetical protein